MMPNRRRHREFLVERQFRRWQTANTSIVFPGKIIQRDIQRIVAFTVAAIDEIRHQLCQIVMLFQRPSILYCQQIFRQRAGFIGGNGGNDANRLNRPHLMNQRFFSSHPPHS